MLALTVVEAFLEDYAEAFIARDGARIAAFYNVPCVTMRADGSIHAFTSQQEIQAFFQRLADTYYRDGSAIRRWRQSYNFVAADASLRILASTIHLP
jgi:ketosteroid isomerase-like protein